MSRPQTRPMPENTVDEISGDVTELSDIREDNTKQDPGGLLTKLAELLGVTPAKIASALGATGQGKSKLPAKCPKCGGRYKFFADEAYTEDQSICPACRDEAMRSAREAAMRPEKLKAERLLRLQEEQAAAKKTDERKELVTLVAETVAQLQKSNAA